MKKRQYRRIPVVFPVDVKIKQVGDVKDFLDTEKSSVWQSHTSDVSKGGMCLSFHNPSSILYDLLALDTVILSLIISVPYSSEPILAFARIVWRKVSVKNGQNVYLVGVEYYDIVEKERRDIFSYAQYLRRRPIYIGSGICVLLILIFVLLSFYAKEHYDVWRHRNQASELRVDNQRLTAQYDSLVKESQELKNRYEHQTNLYQQLQEQMKTIIQKERKVYYQDYILSLEEESERLSQDVYLLSKEKKYFQGLYNQEKKYQWKAQTQVGSLEINSSSQLWCVIKKDSTILWGRSLEIEKDVIHLTLFDFQKISFSMEDVMFYFHIDFVKEDKTLDSSKESKSDHLLDFTHKLLFDLFRYFENEIDATGFIKETSKSSSSVSMDVSAYYCLSLIIGVEEGYLSYDEALQKAHQMFDVHVQLQRHSGFFFDQYVLNEGRWIPSTYTSVLDTSLFVVSVRCLASYFKDEGLNEKVSDFEKEIAWLDVSDQYGVLYVGSSPETGAHPHQLGFYQGGLLAYLLCEKALNYQGDHLYRVIRHLDQHPHNIYPVSLIDQLSSLLFVSPSILPPSFLKYYEQLFIQTMEFFAQQPTRFRPFWGVSNSDSPKGYQHFSVIGDMIEYEGVVTPYVPFAFLSLKQEPSLKCIENYYQTFKDDLYGFYGFYDALNLSQGWFSNVYRGSHCGLALAHIFQIDSDKQWHTYLFSDEKLNRILEQLIVLSESFEAS